MKILIALSTFNRIEITEMCLKNLSSVRSDDIKLVVYDDNSTTYNIATGSVYCDEIVRFPKNIGIDSSRARAMRDFVYRFKEYDLLYFTDNDSIHDPDFVNVLINLFNWQKEIKIRR